ncbi:hypothetical protein VR46_18075 [Streptomyces sp. NRRL S-444]|nr:hypothetical protein VR46_18075 [Streptomyces sp. NRRL S-444]
MTDGSSLVSPQRVASSCSTSCSALVHLLQCPRDLRVEGVRGDRVALGRTGLGAQGAAAGLDHRQVGVAVGLFGHDPFEEIGGLVAVVGSVVLGLLLTHGASLRTGSPGTFDPAVSGRSAPGAT